MNLVCFSGGPQGVPVWINPDAVSSVQKDPDPKSTLTMICKIDGKEIYVQEPLEKAVEMLRTIRR